MIKFVQCRDDGGEDDIRLCEPLRQAGIKASFNLNPSLPGAQRGASWRYQDYKDVSRLAKPELRSVHDGFTTATHSLTHPMCPAEIPLDQGKTEVNDGRKNTVRAVTRADHK